MTAEAQLALSRQKLRQQVAAGARPLAMSGWEDLVDEAAADLEIVEGHVAAAAQRLVELQVLKPLECEGGPPVVGGEVLWLQPRRASRDVSLAGSNVQHNRLNENQRVVHNEVACCKEPDHSTEVAAGLEVPMRMFYAANACVLC